MKLLKNFILFTLFNFSESQLAGSQRDDHGCVLDGGYQWCEERQSCIRPWETSCESSIVNVDFCSISNIQTCRMACDEPECSSGQCAMRVGNCCDYTCVTSVVGPPPCPPCPPPYPCPYQEMMPNCNMVEPVTDYCGCRSGCPTMDCSSSPLHNVVGEGETCGGYMPYDMVNHCADGLECVYTMGPMIADAPGTCMETCSTFRDAWGNCVDEDCHSWNDGCNVCEVNSNVLENCSENACYMKPSEEGRCMDTETSEDTTIPMDCLTWYDGCNTCSVNNGILGACTMMYCFRNDESRCLQFLDSELSQGDICYRFCEDGSESSIDNSENCPKGSECMPSDISMISYDSCGDRAHRCIPFNGH